VNARATTDAADLFPERAQSSVCRQSNSNLAPGCACRREIRLLSQTKYLAAGRLGNPSAK
jgi:hypothetical protein